MARGGGGFPGTSKSTGRTAAAPPAQIKLRSEHAARNGATADSHDAPGRRHGFPCLEERAAHVFTHRSDDEQKIRGTRRRCKEESQPMEIVKRVVELLDLMKAGTAISGVHHHYMEGLYESRGQRFGACLLFRNAGPFESGLPIHWRRNGQVAPLAVDAFPVVYNRSPANSTNRVDRADRRGKVSLVYGD